MTKAVWVFVAPRAQFPSGIFESTIDAEKWISTYSLTGTLTEFHVGFGVYDWALQEGFFKPKPDKVIDASFIGSFTSASMRHFHYENGIKLY